MSTPRPYRSELRAERARDTKVRIRESARELYAAQGLTETTVAQIAEHAGVAPQTVYAAFGTKGAIVGAMLEELEEAAGQAEWVDRILSEHEPRRQLRVFVAWIRTLFETGAPIIRTALAARHDPDVAALIRRGDANRMEGTRQLAGMWHESASLRDGLEAEDAASRLWLLTFSEQFLLAVDELDWSPSDYEQWLGDLLEHELLRPDTDAHRGT